MKLKIIRLVFPILLVLWMIMIFNLSAQTASESSDVSAAFTDRLFSVIYPGYNDMSEEAQRELLSDFSFLIRKTAHFSLYFIMGVLSFFSFITYDRLSLLVRSSISVSVCALFSATDEFHQTFVSGRSGELRDVFIDSSGAVLAVLLLVLLIKIIFRKKSGVMNA